MNDKPPPPYPIKDIHRATKAAITKAFGYKSAGTIDKWDCPRNAGGTYDLPEVIKWRIKDQVEKMLPLDGDALMFGGGPITEGLERLRMAKAKIAELDLAVKKGELIHVETMDGILSGLSALLRSMGEKLQRAHGEEARLILDETLDAFEKQLQKSTKTAND